MDGQQKPTVFIHEDDEALLDALCDSLEMLGYPVVGTSGMLQPNRLRFRGMPGIFIMDLMLMNEPSGIELTRTLKERGMKCPVIAITASPMMAEQARESGLFADVLNKPDGVLALHLVSAIDKALAPQEG